LREYLGTQKCGFVSVLSEAVTGEIYTFFILPGTFPAVDRN